MNTLITGDRTMHPWTLYAAEVARDRQREAEHARLVAEARDAQPVRPSRLRRPAARVLAAVSLGSAAAVRRLDECIADDLGRSLAAAE